MKFAPLLLAALLPVAVHAKPTPEEVRKVVDFYNNGKSEGVVLTDVKLCESIGTEGEMKNECQGELNPSDLTAGTPATVWMMFMVPVGLDQQEILVQANHQGTTRQAETATVSNSLRYRIWRKLKLDRPGDWTVTISHDNGQNTEVLRELKLQVKPK